jgi:hypothetical protein
VREQFARHYSILFRDPADFEDRGFELMSSVMRIIAMYENQNDIKERFI